MDDEALREIIVIPDLHGRLDALEAVLRGTGFVGADGGLTHSEKWLVQLGDMLDRGPHPRACVERLMGLQAQAPERVRVLRGNHEEMALGADTDPMLKRLWLLNGGGSTLADYDGGFEALLRPDGSHFEWLDGLPLFFEFKNVLFCHAGLAKKKHGQIDSYGILWDRPPLVRGSYRAVICGHTPTASGRVEESSGVWYCDIGLGHGTEKALEILILSVGDKILRSRIASL